MSNKLSREEAWIRAYSDAPKDFLKSNNNTIKKRLTRLGVLSLPCDSKILDLGCGDSGAIRLLRSMGFEDVFGLECSLDVLSLSTFRGFHVNADGGRLPFRSNSLDCVFILGVLHHLPDTKAILSITKEIQRVLRVGGMFAFCEPAPTVWRGVLTRLLFSPLSGLTHFSRTKRALVSLEWPEYSRWLSNYDRNVQLITDLFAGCKRKRGIIKDFYVLTKK